MMLLKKAQSSKGTKAQRNDKNINEWQRHKDTKNISIKNSVPVCLCASVPNRRGLTLLEIAISMAILSIALVALANFFPIGLKASRRASNFSEAGILAQRVIENIKRAASLYDTDDKGINISGPNCSDCHDTGYFELVNQDPLAYPFDDDNLVRSDGGTDANDYQIYRFQYNDTSMRADVKSVNWDIDNDGNNDWKLSQKVYVAIYWKEGEIERADTFITYISNPFYEKYK